MARYKLANLLPGIQYAVQLRSHSGDMVSEWSRIFYITTETDGVAPATPANFTWVVSGTSFLAQWDAVTTNSNAAPLMDFDYYQLTLTNDVNTVVYKTDSTVFNFTFEMNRAAFGTPDNQVKATLRAVDKSGNQGAPTSQLTATNPAPSAPASASADGLVDSINVSWESVVADDLKGYNVHISTSGSGFTPSGANLVWSGLGNSFTYTTSSYVEHFVKVAAVDVFDQVSGYASTSATPFSAAGVDSVAPGIPTSLVVDAVLNTNDAGRADFTLTWVDPGDSDLAGISVRYRKTSGETPYQYITVPPGTQTTVIRNLFTGVDYTFQVAAFDFSANYSAYSTADTETESNVAPSKPNEATLVGDKLAFAVTHDLTKDAGGALESDVVALNVYVGTTATWGTASPVLVDVIPISPGSAVAVSARIQLNVPDGDPNRWIYIKAVDSSGLLSVESGPTAVSIGALTGTYIENATITSAKIQSLEANKIIAGTGIINDLTVKSILQVGDASTSGEVKSYQYTNTAGASGWSLQEDALIIKTGTIEAAALKIQNSQNLMPIQYADFEWAPDFYADDQFVMPASTALATSGSNERFGNQSLEVISSASGSRTLGFAPAATLYDIDVESSTSYIVSAYVYQSSGSAKNLGLHVTWGDTTTSAQTPVSVANNTMTRLSYVVTSPAAVTQARVGITFDAAYTFYIDGIQFELKESQLTTPSMFRPPSQTRVDGGYIRTGEIRSNTTVEVAGETQPAWSINMAGIAQLGDAYVRGTVAVGDPTEVALPDASIRSSVAANDGSESIASLITNHGFETDTTGWQVTGGTFARSTVDMYVGTASAKLTPNGSTADVFFETTVAASPAVTPGVSYYFSFVEKSSSGAGWSNLAQTHIRWLDSSNALISTSSTNSATDLVSSTKWVHKGFFATAPALAAKAQLRRTFSATPAASKNLYVDKMQFFVTPSTFTVAKPSGVIEGDILVAFVSGGETPVTTVPTGGTTWSLLRVGDTTNVWGVIWWKVAGPAEPSTYTFSYGNLSSGNWVGEQIISIIAVQDAGQTAPLVKFLSGPDDSTGDPDTWVVISPTSVPSRSHLELRMAATIGNVTNTWTPPAGFTEITDLQDPDLYTWHTVVSKHYSTGGATGIAEHQPSAFSNRRQGFTVNILDATDTEFGASKIKSANFSTGVLGWSINSDGSAEFNDVIVRNDLAATRLFAYNADFVGVVIDPDVDWSPKISFEHPDISAGPNLEYFFDLDNVINEFVISAGRYDSLDTLVPYIKLSGDWWGTYGGDFYDVLIASYEYTGGVQAAGITHVVIDGDVQIPYMRPLQASSSSTFTFNNVTPSGTAVVTGSAPSTGIVFVAPASGQVFVSISGEYRSTQTAHFVGLSWSLKEGGTIGSGTEIVGPTFRRSLLTGENVDSGEPLILGATHRVLVEALTPGDTYNVQIMHYVNSSGGAGSCDQRYISVEPTW